MDVDPLYFSIKEIGCPFKCRVDLVHWIETKSIFIEADVRMMEPLLQDKDKVRLNHSFQSILL